MDNTEAILEATAEASTTDFGSTVLKLLHHELEQDALSVGP